MKKKWLRCAKCGVVDRSIKADARNMVFTMHVGTLETMRCEDCCGDDPKGRAQLCRICCPTRHGTI